MMGCCTPKSNDAKKNHRDGFTIVAVRENFFFLRGASAARALAEQPQRSVKLTTSACIP